MNGAAKNGHLAVVKWLHDNRCEGCTTRAMDDAARKGYLDVIRWLHDSRVEGCSERAILDAAYDGHFEVVQWLYSVYGKSFFELNLTRAAALTASEGHLEVLQVFATDSWFSHPECLRPIMVKAFEKGRLSVMEWLVGLGCEVHAVDKVWIPLMKITYRGSELSVPDERPSVVMEGDIWVARWLFCHGCNMENIDCRIFVVSKLPLLRWLHENELVQLDYWTGFEILMDKNCPEIVEWLPEHDRVSVVLQVLSEDKNSNQDCVDT